jgi:hypothetical protein
MRRKTTKLRLLSANSETNRVLFPLRPQLKLDHAAMALGRASPAGVMCPRGTARPRTSPAPAIATIPKSVAFCCRCYSGGASGIVPGGFGYLISGFIGRGRLGLTVRAVRPA